MKRILINATQQEELRVAIVDGQKLYNLDIEVPSRAQNKANIFKGVITRVEPSLEAAFVNYGSERHGFLPMKEIVSDYYQTSDGKVPKGKVSIKDVIKEGQEVVVQVEKPERGNKGAALTTKISLAGRYLVLMPTEPRAGGISRRIEGEDRSMVREAMEDLNVPDEMGTIVRTAGIGRSAEELQWDVDYLVSLWKAIAGAAEERKAPFLIYQDSSIIIRALRDHYNSDIGEIICDDEKVYQQAQEFVQQVMPHNLRKLKLYQERVPLFNRFQIETQIESAFQREVSLPSGGAIVIDHTEALISIDVNSARSTKGGDIEDTARNTNLEAADEVARQLRLRDLGGLVVIDFIDMTSNKNQREVESRLKTALKHDRARVQIGRISRFGLLEMSRQRLRPSLGESSQEVCPVCSGHGTIRGVESLSLSILRLLEEEAIKDKTGRLVAQLPVDVATFLLNEKRSQIAGIEERHDVDIIMVPNLQMDRPHFRVERIREGDQEHASHSISSFELADEKEPEPPKSNRPRHEVNEVQQAAVQAVVPPTQMPVRTAPPAPVAAAAPAPIEQPGLVVRLWKSLFGTGTPSEAEAESKKTAKAESPKQARSNQRKPRSSGNRAEKQGADGRKKSTKDDQRKPRNSKQAEKQPRSNRNAPNNNEPRKPASRERKPKADDQQQDKNQSVAETKANTAAPAAAQDGQNEERQTSSRRRRSRNPRSRRSASADTRTANENQTESSSDAKAADKPAPEQTQNSPAKAEQQPRRQRRSRNDPRAGLPESTESTKTDDSKSLEKTSTVSEKAAPEKASADKPKAREAASQTSAEKPKSEAPSAEPKPVVVPLKSSSPKAKPESKPASEKAQEPASAEKTETPKPKATKRKPAEPSKAEQKPVLVKTKAPSTPPTDTTDIKPAKDSAPKTTEKPTPAAEKPKAPEPKLERVIPKAATKPVAPAAEPAKPVEKPVEAKAAEPKAASKQAEKPAQPTSPAPKPDGKPAEAKAAAPKPTEKLAEAKAPAPMPAEKTAATPEPAKPVAVKDTTPSADTETASPAKKTDSDAG